MVNTTKTERGFEVIRFVDLYHNECSLQQSSLATESAIWFGVDDNRMHLSRDQLIEVLPYLVQWLISDSFLPKKKTND